MFRNVYQIFNDLNKNKILFPNALWVKIIIPPFEKKINLVYIKSLNCIICYLCEIEKIGMPFCQ